MSQGRFLLYSTRHHEDFAVASAQPMACSRGEPELTWLPAARAPARDLLEVRTTLDAIASAAATAQAGAVDEPRFCVFSRSLPFRDELGRRRLPLIRFAGRLC